VQAVFLAEILGEVVLTERAVLDGTTLEGVPPRAILSVENVGTYLDPGVPAAARGLWLEQEVLTLDARMAEALREAVPRD